MNSSFLLTLVLATVLVFGVVKTKNNLGSSLTSPIKENFLGNLPNFTYKVDRVMQNGRGDMFTVPGTYSAILAPRFSNVGYGAYIRYSFPALQNTGVPSDPLTFGSMISPCSGPDVTLANNAYPKYNYGGSLEDGGSVECYNGVGAGNGNGNGDNGPRCGDGLSLYSSSPMTSSNYSYASSQMKYTNVSDMLPVGDMTMVSATGEVTQPIVYDRFVYANQRSRLYGLGDPIRGDLPIVPCSGEWFRPSVDPQIALRDGAMMVMGGADNSTNRELLALQYASSGGTQNVGSGVNFAVQSSPFTTAAGGDVHVTAFP